MKRSRNYIPSLSDDEFKQLEKLLDLDIEALYNLLQAMAFYIDGQTYNSRNSRNNECERAFRKTFEKVEFDS